METEKCIVLFGAGNLANHLAPVLQRTGYRVLQVISRNIDSASILAAKLGAIADTDYTNLIHNADYYLICVNDSQIEKVIQASFPENKFFIHTSGSTSISIFNTYCSRYGVLYPLQTFSKTKPIDMRQVPFFLEASTSFEMKHLKQMASGISDFVREADSEQRLYLHICAVFTCAFTNQMYRVAEKICQDKGLPFELLHPLLLESAAKASQMSPESAQTGPGSQERPDNTEKAS